MTSKSSSLNIEFLLKEEPIVQESLPPIIIVGLPRSGSTFLAHVLSCMDGLYVFDDLYPYQGAKSLGLQGSLSLNQQKDFLNKLSWAARAKVKFKKNIYAFAPQCTWEEISALESSTLTSLEGKDVTWPSLLEEWLTRLAFYHGCKRWGYKTPQDFMHLEELSKLFPGVQFVFVMRDPRKVMASFKNLPKKREKKAPDGVSSQYHPLIYSVYWKMAYQKIISFMESHPTVPVYITKFEELVANPENEAEKLAQFLGTKITKSVQVERTNSSFSSEARKDITDTEAWLCEVIAGDIMRETGYLTNSVKPRIADLKDLLDTSANFLLYQIRRFYSDNRARESISNYIKNLLSRRER